MRLAERVREAFKKEGFIKKASALFRILDVKNELDKNAIRQLLKGMVIRGEAIRENGGFRFLYKERADSKVDKIWRAWRYSSVWTVNEIAQVTGIKRNYVKLILTQYKNAGYIERVGKRGITPLYRMVNRDLRERPRILK